MNERLVISWMKCINLKFSLKCLTGMFSPFPFSSMPRHRIPKLHYTCVVLQISLEWLFTVTTNQKKQNLSSGFQIVVPEQINSVGQA